MGFHDGHGDGTIPSNTISTPYYHWWGFKMGIGFQNLVIIMLLSQPFCALHKNIQ
jgi:hypothetical protein